MLRFRARKVVSTKVKLCILLAKYLPKVPVRDRFQVTFF
jgi:hypothetical protein